MDVQIIMVYQFMLRLTVVCFAIAFFFKRMILPICLPRVEIILK